MSNSIFNLMRSAAAAAPVAAKLKKASQDIEAIFMKDLLTAMRRTSPHKAMGSSYGSDMYMDLVDQAISEGASRNGTLGIGKSIYRQMAPLAIQAAMR
ncbi:MAG TPA: rod-binding protein, partial [Fimbriimonadaceae bacterium]|nr:rod-binding protein [Fimbriimonadaceae bacterium]